MPTLHFFNRLWNLKCWQNKGIETFHVCTQRPYKHYLSNLNQNWTGGYNLWAKHEETLTQWLQVLGLIAHAGNLSLNLCPGEITQKHIGTSNNSIKKVAINYYNFTFQDANVQISYSLYSFKSDEYLVITSSVSQNIFWPQLNHSVSLSGMIKISMQQINMFWTVVQQGNDLNRCTVKHSYTTETACI